MSMRVCEDGTSYFFQTKSGSLLAKAFFFPFQPISRFLHPPKERSMPHQQTTDRLVNQ
jgi:hypothetical protein